MGTSRFIGLCRIANLCTDGGTSLQILTSCKELALHEINAVIEALTGAILAVRDAMAEAPSDPTEPDQGHGREWARKYEVILSSCRRYVPGICCYPY